MLVILYLQNGFFVKPDRIEFDPHSRVGYLLIDPQAMEILAERRKILCRCYRDERVFLDREVFMTSVNVRTGLGAFKYEDFLPERFEDLFDREAVVRIAKKVDLMDLIESLNDLVEMVESGEGDFEEWIESFDPGIRKEISKFAQIYVGRLLKDIFKSDLNLLRRKSHAITFRLYEMIGDV